MSVSLVNDEGVKLVFDQANEIVLVLSCHDEEGTNHEISHVKYEGKNLVGTSAKCPDCKGNPLSLVVAQKRLYGLNANESKGIQLHNSAAHLRLQKAKERIAKIKARREKMFQRLQRKETPNRAMRRKKGTKIKLIKNGTKKQ